MEVCQASQLRSLCRNMTLADRGGWAGHRIDVASWEHIADASAKSARFRHRL